MTKTQFKDAIRNVWRNFVSYISITLIALLSIATYLGVSSASVNLKKGANNYYKDANFYDIELISTMLLSNDDIEALRAMNSVGTVVPFCYTTVGCENAGVNEYVNITTCMDEIAIPTILSGNAPASENECMIEDRLAESMSYKVGDTISFFGNDGEAPSYLNGTDYKITGIFSTPLHIKPSVKDNSYVIVKEAAFNQDKLKGCYMRAYIRMSDRGNDNFFSDSYSEKVDKVKNEIEALASERTAIRDAQIRDMYQSEIDKNEEKLSDAKTKLDAADASLTDAEKEIKAGDEKLEKSKEELAKLKKELADGKKLLDSSKEQLDAGKAKLDASKAKLDNANYTLAEKKGLLDSAKNELDAYDREISENEQKIAAAQEELNAAKAKLDSAKQQLDAGKKELEDAYFEGEARKAEFREEIKTIINKVMEIAGIDVTINWASPRTTVNLETDNIQDFYITETYKVDLLNDTLQGAVEGLIEDLGFSKYYDPERYDDIVKAVNAYLDTIGADKAKWKAEIEEYRAKIRQWNEGRDKYLASLAEYNKGYETYQTKLAEFNEASAKVASARQQWNEKKALYDYNYLLYQNAYNEYQAGLSEYESYRNLWESKNAEYQAGLQKYDEGVKTYDNYSLEYDKGLKKLAEYTEKFKQNKEKYENGLAEYEEGRKTLDSMKEELEKLNKCEWLTSDIDANVGYKHMGMTVDSLQNLGNNFTVLFVILAALIVYATISRIINEQHVLVGTTKAFGFRPREILDKYMLFGMTGLFMGLLLGILVSIFFQKFALSVFVKNYVLETPKAIPVLYVLIIVVVVSMLITVAAVMIATGSLLKQPATDLLRASMPKGIKKGESSGKNAFSLFQRLIIRNVRTDLTRVVVTVASVAGCCALINIGFSMKYDFKKTEVIEFEERLQYDLNINYNTSDKDSTLKDVEKILDAHNAEYAECMTFYSTFKADEGSEIVEVVVTDVETVQNFYKFTDSKKKTVTLGKDGIYLKSGYADAYHIKPGDTLSLLNDRGVEMKVTLAGTYENYTGQRLYMDNEYYKTVFGEDPRVNKCMVKCSPDDKDALKADLEKCSYITSVESSDETRKDFTAYSGSLNALLILILVVAILMAAIIISNLTFMYIDKKKTEIIVMRINGFSFKEVRTYLLNESLFTTFIGIVIGLLGGSLLASSIIMSFEKPHLQLYKGINLKAWLMSTLVTVIFTLVINLLALRKVKKMQLTDITKI